MSDRDITIELRAKQITDEAFKKVQASIKSLEGTAGAAGHSMAGLGQLTADASKHFSIAEHAAGALKSTFGQMFAGFGAFTLLDRGISTLAAWGKEALDSAGAVVDLANKTGLSTETIQRFQFVAGQTGTSVENFTKAAFQLGLRLNGGENSVKAGVAALGLSYQQLMDLSPDEQFDKITGALGNLTVEQGRNTVAVDLFGKSAADILPAIAEGYAKIASQAAVTKDEQIRALDEAGDAWDAFIARQKAAFAGFLGNQVIAAQAISKLNPYQQDQLNDLAATDAGKITEFLTRIAKGQQDVALSTKKSGASVRENAEAMEAAKEAAKKLKAEAEQLVTHVNANTKAEFANELALRRVNLEFLDQIEKQRTLGMVMPPLIEHYSYLATAINDTRSPLERMQENLQASAGVMGGQFAAAQMKATSIIDKARAAIERETEAIQKGAQFGSQLASSIIAGAQNGKIGESVGGFLGDEIGKSLGEKLAKAIGGKLGGALGGMLGPLGAIGGQLVGSLVDKMFGHKGRDAVKQFADSFGGLPELQKKLQATFDPATANKYWVALTQGVGRNNPEQAKQVIDAVTAAIDRQEAALKKTPRSFADASAAAEALGLDINKIGDGINDLRVHDSAEAIAAQWQVLKDAGADMDQVAEGAAGKFQVLVDEALKWGHELPESMREPLQRMADMGKLTDASGDKLEDLSGIKFAEPLEKSVDRVIDKIDQLIDRISSGLGGALRNIPGVDVNVNGSGEPEASHDVGAYIRRDHVANVHAGEIVGPMDFMTRALEGALARTKNVATGGSVIVQIGTRELARTLMPEIANEVKTLRLGIA
jgi:F0F1-type ATP synthase membrane subunit b/b'